MNQILIGLEWEPQLSLPTLGPKPVYVEMGPKAEVYTTLSRHVLRVPYSVLGGLVTVDAAVSNLEVRTVPVPLSLLPSAVEEAEKALVRVLLYLSRALGGVPLGAFLPVPRLRVRRLEGPVLEYKCLKHVNLSFHLSHLQWPVVELPRGYEGRGRRLFLHLDDYLDSGYYFKYKGQVVLGLAVVKHHRWYRGGAVGEEDWDWTCGCSGTKLSHVHQSLVRDGVRWYPPYGRLHVKVPYWFTRYEDLVDQVLLHLPPRLRGAEGEGWVDYGMHSVCRGVDRWIFSNLLKNKEKSARPLFIGWTRGGSRWVRVQGLG